MQTPILLTHAIVLGSRLRGVLIAALIAQLGPVLIFPARAQSDPREVQLQQDLSQLLTTEKLAGAAYSTVRDGSVQTGSIGSFHAGRQLPMAVDAKVNIGSITKTLVGLAVLRLVSEGRVSLDAPVETLLPGVKFDNKWSDTSPVLLRHLLDHTAGLEDLRLWHMFSARTSPDQSLSLALQRDPSVLRLRSEPGRICSYSNLGYTLAAMVIEAVVQERYEDWADRELLRPLGMHDSSFGFLSQEAIVGGPSADPRLAWGHLDNLDAVAALPVAVRPAGQFSTTAADMGRLMQFLLGRGDLEGESFIRPDLMAALGRPSGTDAAKIGLAMGYGLGLSTRDRHGAVGLCHAGSVIGFRAMMCVYRDQQRAFFISINSDSETAKYDRFDERLIAHLDLPVAEATLTMPESEESLSDWQGRYVLEPNRFDIARLPDILFNSWTMTAQDHGSAMLTVAARAPVVLWPVGARLARQDDRVQASYALLFDDQQRRVISDGYRSARQISPLAYGSLVVGAMAGGLGLAYWLIRVLSTFLAVLPGRRGPTFARLKPLAGAALALFLLIVPVPLFLVQPWLAVGDPGAATWMVYLGTLSLPILLLAQAVISWRHGPRLGLLAWVDVGAALAVLQLCALLAVWGVLPLALWR